MSKSLYTIPNLLCYFRLAVIPVMTVLFFFDAAWAAWTNVVLFALAGISDFLDGYLARRLGQTTLLGKFLDSSSDKMLVGVILMLLVAFGQLQGVWILPAVIIFLREILISGVREFMALYQVVIPVTRLAKWKLTIQVVAIAFLIAGPYGESLIPYSHAIGRMLILVAMVVTVMSGWDYLRMAFRSLREIDDKAAG